MAGLLMACNSGEVALVANTAKSILQIKAPTNQRVHIRQLRLFGKQAAGGTDTPVKVRLTRSTASFGTWAASGTPGKLDPSQAEVIQTLFSVNASVEPTTPTDSGMWWEVQPQLGIIEFQPMMEPIKIPGGQSVQFEFTSVSTPTVMMEVTVEE